MPHCAPRRRYGAGYWALFKLLFARAYLLSKRTKLFVIVRTIQVRRLLGQCGRRCPNWPGAGPSHPQQAWDALAGGLLSHSMHSVHHCDSAALTQVTPPGATRSCAPLLLVYDHCGCSGGTPCARAVLGALSVLCALCLQMCLMSFVVATLFLHIPTTSVEDGGWGFGGRRGGAGQDGMGSGVLGVCV